MEIQLTPDQKAFIRQAIESGRIGREEEAVTQALLLWEERERRRLEILAALDAAEADVKSGHYTDHTTETLPVLAETLKHEARISRNDK